MARALEGADLIERLRDQRISGFNASMDVREEAAKELERLRNWHDLRCSYDEHPGGDPESWRAYERMPIQIHTGAVILIQLFKGGLQFNDMWAHDMNDMQRAHHDGLYKRAAEQFHKQLEGHDCVGFWLALRDEADKVIREWREACGKFDNTEVARGGGGSSN